MATTYSELLKKVRDWSNRDAEALPLPVIQDSLRWAADTAYRELRVPPLEFTQQYLVRVKTTAFDGAIDPTDATQVIVETTNSGQPGFTTVKLPVPADASTFIQLRTSGRAIRNEDDDAWLLNDDETLDVRTGGLRDIQVFNEKVDVRTFHDAYATKVSAAFWTRQQDNLLVTGNINQGDVIELFYFRRLSALDARYGLVADDFQDDAFDVLVDTLTMIAGTADVPVTPEQISMLEGLDGLPLENPSLSPGDFEFFATGDDREGWYAGMHIQHWLRDENERILIFGALNECFAYLADDAQSSKYLQKYLAEIAELNKEEKMRKSSGGNVQVHYNSYII